MELAQEEEDGSWELFLKGLAAELCPGCGAYGHTVAICPTQYEEEELPLQELEEEEPVCPVSGGEEPVCPVSGGEEPVCPVSGGEEPVCPVSGGEEPVCPVEGRSQCILCLEGRSQCVLCLEGRRQGVLWSSAETPATSPSPAVGGAGSATSPSPAVGGADSANSSNPAVGGAGSATSPTPAVGGADSANSSNPAATLAASRQASSLNASSAQPTSASQATVNLTTSSGGGALLTSRATGPVTSTQASALNQSVLLGSAGAGQGQMYLRVNRSLRTPLSSQFILMPSGAAAMATVQQQQQQQEVPPTNTSGHPDIDQVQNLALRCPPSSAVVSVSAAPGLAQRTTLPKTEGAGQGEKKAGGEGESGGRGVGINLTKNTSNSQATLITTGARQPGQASAQALGLTQVISISSAQSCNSNSSTMDHIHNIQHSGVSQQHVHVKPLSGAVHDNSQANRHQQGGGGGGGKAQQPMGSGNVGVSPTTTTFGNVGIGFSSSVMTAAVLPQQLQLPQQQSPQQQQQQQHQQKQQPQIVRPCSGAICGSVGPGTVSGASAAMQTSAMDVTAKTGSAAASGVYVQPLQLQVKQPVGGIKRKVEADELNETKRESPPSLHPSLEGPYQKPDNTPEKNQASDLTPLDPSLSSPSTACRGVASGPSLLSSSRHRNDSKPPQAIVKPQVLTHLIEGFVIQEGAEPFPVGGPVKDRQEGVSPLLAPSPSSLPDHYYQNTVSNRKSSLLKCEYCGNLEPAQQFRGSKRFCSMTCAKRYNVSCSQQFRLKHKKVKGAGLGDGGGVRMRRRGPHRSSSEIACAKIIGRHLDIKTRSDSSRGSDENSSYEDEAPSPSPSPFCSRPSHSEQAARDSSGSAPAELPLDGVPRFLSGSPAHWSVEEVSEFISSLHGCQQVATEFLAQEIDGQALLLLKEEHLMTAMNIKLGPALKICACINMLKEG
ncbi:UNVERIFIED_CONTAM: hypothetical protein FKN15_016622 [Acipenser sinensis]